MQRDELSEQQRMKKEGVTQDRRGSEPNDEGDDDLATDDEN